MKLLTGLPSAFVNAGQWHGFFDDFYQYTSDDRWTLVTAVDGSATLQDAVGGKVAILSATVTAGNEDTYLRSVGETFKFAADKPFVFESLVDFTEINTDDANVIIGVMDAVAANALVDDGAGPKSSYSGAVFFKVDGGTTWSVENSVGTTQKTTNLDGNSYINGKLVDAQAAGGGVATTLRIEWFPTSSTKGDFLFFIDGILVAKHTDQVYTSATEMEVILGVKDGSAANEETLNVDYVGCYQKR